MATIRSKTMTRLKLSVLLLLASKRVEKSRCLREWMRFRLPMWVWRRHNRQASRCHHTLEVSEINMITSLLWCKTQSAESTGGSNPITRYPVTTTRWQKDRNKLLSFTPNHHRHKLAIMVSAFTPRTRLTWSLLINRRCL